MIERSLFVGRVSSPVLLLEEHILLKEIEARLAFLLFLDLNLVVESSHDGLIL